MTELIKRKSLRLKPSAASTASLKYLFKRKKIHCNGGSPCCPRVTLRKGKELMFWKNIYEKEKNREKQKNELG